MKLPQNDKPTLQDLFDSKKLDQPNDEFWNDFQEQVRIKTLSSVVTDNSSFSSSQFLAYCSCIIILFGITIYGFFKFSLENTDLVVDSNSVDTSLNPSLDAVKEGFISKDLDLLSSFTLENADYFDNDSNLFVEQSFDISSLETTFQHRVLVPQILNSDDSMIEFTF